MASGRISLRDRGTGCLRDESARIVCGLEGDVRNGETTPFVLSMDLRDPGLGDCNLAGCGSSHRGFESAGNSHITSRPRGDGRCNDPFGWALVGFSLPEKGLGAIKEAVRCKSRCRKLATRKRLSIDKPVGMAVGELSKKSCS